MESNVDGESEVDETVPLAPEEVEVAETEVADGQELAEAFVAPPNPVKVDALRRLKALERRGKTVGTHLDELRALLTVLFEQMPD